MNNRTATAKRFKNLSDRLHMEAGVIRILEVKTTATHYVDDAAYQLWVKTGVEAQACGLVAARLMHPAGTRR